MAASERERVELERALQQQMTAIQWHAMPSRLLPNHPEYYDDPCDGVVSVNASVERFIEINRAVLLDYWHYRIDTDQLRQRLRNMTDTLETIAGLIAEFQAEQRLTHAMMVKLGAAIDRTEAHLTDVEQAAAALQSEVGRLKAETASMDRRLMAALPETLRQLKCP
jgi:hypothetical protein